MNRANLLSTTALTAASPIRVALYGRYSSDLQNPKSVDDQFHLCSGYADRQVDWKIVITYRDEAISGDSLILRPGIQELIKAALRGEFDVVLAEALDRLSRDPADMHALYKQLTFAGVRIVTISEGEANDLIIGFKGTMNGQFLKDLRAKTHRGLTGRVLKGKAAGGLSYGYDVVKQLGADGELIRGDRKINETQAEIVRRVLREYADGVSPLEIARRLNVEAKNDESKRGPDGGWWTDSTIRGNPKRGTGFINNELYVGKLVWNRTRNVKNPYTGKRVNRVNGQEMWTVTEVPELRIVDDDLWRRVKARQTALSEKYATCIAAVRAYHASRPVALNATHRPATLFSGLLMCSCCDGDYVKRGQDRFGCSNHIQNKSCSNSRTITHTELQSRVLAGLRGPLMDPAQVDKAMGALVDETDRLNRERSSSHHAAHKSLDEVNKALKEIALAIGQGGYSRTLDSRLRELEAEQDRLEKQIAYAKPVEVYIPPNFGEMLRRKVDNLPQTIDELNDEAIELIRGLIGHITVTPEPPEPGKKRGKIALTLHGCLGKFLERITGVPDDVSASVDTGTRAHRDRHTLTIAI